MNPNEEVRDSSADDENGETKEVTRGELGCAIVLLLIITVGVVCYLWRWHG